MKALFFAAVASIALAGCSASPFKHAEVVGQQAAAAPTVLWGGQVVDVERTDAGTRLKVQAYLLGYGDRPLYGARLGDLRFVVHLTEALDPAEVATGRFLTALGNYVNSESVGAADTNDALPLLVSRQVEFWPAEVYPGSLHPLSLSKEVRNKTWYPAIISRSTASAGFARSVSAGSN